MATVVLTLKLQRRQTVVAKREDQSENNGRKSTGILTILIIGNGWFMKTKSSKSAAGSE